MEDCWKLENNYDDGNETLIKIKKIDYYKKCIYHIVDIQADDRPQ